MYVINTVRVLADSAVRALGGMGKYKILKNIRYSELFQSCVNSWTWKLSPVLKPLTCSVMWVCSKQLFLCMQKYPAKLASVRDISGNCVRLAGKFVSPCYKNQLTGLKWNRLTRKMFIWDKRNEWPSVKWCILYTEYNRAQLWDGWGISQKWKN